MHKKVKTRHESNEKIYVSNTYQCNVVLCRSRYFIFNSCCRRSTSSKKQPIRIIQITARKRVENAQEVPVAVSALQGDSLDAYSSAGMDIRFMNAKIPSLSIESSFGRSFPRFYVRGLGNTDFDLNASQPVSLVVDEVVQENAILKVSLYLT